MTEDQPYSYKIVSTQADGTLLDSDPVRFPPEVQPVDMLSYLTATFGAPIEDAVTDTNEFGLVQVGWVFQPLPDADDSVRDITVIPLIDDPDDPSTSISVFVHQEQLRAEFTRTMNDAGVAIETITPAPEGHHEAP